MHYGITSEGTEFSQDIMSNWRVRILKVALFFIPRANPDNEHLYPKVRSWALELDEQGWPQREVGLDATGKPLFAAPDDRNTGFWPDMAHKQFDLSELQMITAGDFDQLWSAAQASA